MSIFDGALPPASDELEVTVIGPGYGESIVVHLGHHEWLVVDSCRPRGTDIPAAKVYLETLGVPPSQVKYLLVSHWHDDHTCGISELAEFYSSARIGVSNVLNLDEGKRFVAAYSGQVSPLSRGTKELFKIFKEHKARVEPLGQNRLVFSRTSGIPVAVTALSPTDGFFLNALALLHGMVPPRDRPASQGEAPMFSPNNEAVVVHVSVGQIALLLGSDLETSRQGWSVVANSPHTEILSKAEWYKVAHHGSESAECQQVWDRLLTPRPLSVLTPFNHGRHRLPNRSDRARILDKSSSAHISSQASLKSAVDPNILRRLEAMSSQRGVSIKNSVAGSGRPVPLHAGFGAVRSRKSLLPGGTWQVMHFGSAATLNRN